MAAHNANVRGELNFIAGYLMYDFSKFFQLKNVFSQSVGNIYVFFFKCGKFDHYSVSTSHISPSALWTSGLRLEGKREKNLIFCYITP